MVSLGKTVAMAYRASNMITVPTPTGDGVLTIQCDYIISLGHIIHSLDQSHSITLCYIEILPLSPIDYVVSIPKYM